MREREERRVAEIGETLARYKREIGNCQTASNEMRDEEARLDALIPDIWKLQMRQRGRQAWQMQRQQGWSGKLDQLKMDHMKQLKLDHLDFIPDFIPDFWEWQMRQRGMQAWHWKRQQGWRGKLDQLNQLKLDHLNQLKKEKEKEKEEEK